MEEKKSLRPVLVPRNKTYGTREELWRPTEFNDFCDGGASLEMEAMQFPINNSNSSNLPPSLEMNFEQPLIASADAQLSEENRVKREEHESFKRFMKGFREEGGDVSRYGPLRDAKEVPVIDGQTCCPIRFEEEYVLQDGGVGLPCVIKNAIKNDPTSNADLLTLCLEAEITVNDRAPARKTDKFETKDGKQNTLICTARRYNQYLDDRTHSDSDSSGAPYYCNGWRVFSRYPEKLKGYFNGMKLRFLEVSDHTELILQQTFAIITK